MTLKEKLCEPFGGLRTETTDKLEQIADDYAIEFANWLFNINKEVLIKQLKEFKKEKGL
jgi:hypothetical protein